MSGDYKTLTYIYDTVNSSTGFDRYPLGYTASDLDEKHTENVVKIMTEGGRAEKYLYSYRTPRRSVPFQDNVQICRDLKLPSPFPRSHMPNRYIAVQALQ